MRSPRKKSAKLPAEMIRYRPSAIASVSSQMMQRDGVPQPQYHSCRPSTLSWTVHKPVYRKGLSAKIVGADAFVTAGSENIPDIQAVAHG